MGDDVSHVLTTEAVVVFVVGAEEHPSADELWSPALERQDRCQQLAVV